RRVGGCTAHRRTVFNLRNVALAQVLRQAFRRNFCNLAAANAPVRGDNTADDSGQSTHGSGSKAQGGSIGSADVFQRATHGGSSTETASKANWQHHAEPIWRIKNRAERSEERRVGKACS